MNIAVIGIGEVVASDELSNCTKQIMHEISSIARKRGVALPESIENDSFAKGKNFPFEAKTSFQRDFENIDKPTKGISSAGQSYAWE